MILTILRITYLRLRNNPLELLLIFVMPVVFFSIFAAIFSNGIATGGDKKLRVGWITDRETALSTRLQLFVEANSSLECKPLEIGDEGVDTGIAVAQRSDRFDVIIRLPEDFPDALPAEADADVCEVQLITDGQNPMAVSMVKSVVEGFFAQERASVTAERLLSLSGTDQYASRYRGVGSGAAGDEQTFESEATEYRETMLSEQFDCFEPAMEPAEFFTNSWEPEWLLTGADGVVSVNGQAGLPAEWLSARQSESRLATTAELLETVTTSKPVSESAEWMSSDVVRISVDNPQAANQENPRIAMYAAGIAVLFLLFSSTGNAAALLEEAESGTLDRVLVGKAGLFHIIAGKWLGIFLLGCVQITVMFVWAELVFRIQLWKHLDGFVVMTVCTAAATSSFAMVMATLCKSRPQLNAVSVVLILSMSAVGGSMIPRFVMSDRMKQVGKWTFNAWALDGYQKVFWFQSPIMSLQLEVCVLLGSAFVLGLLALMFSRRWKRG